MRDPMMATTLSLTDLVRGERAVIAAVSGDAGSACYAPQELEQRLLEIGFVEGAMVELLHRGWFGAGPLAVRVNDSTVAVRSQEAKAITLRRAA